ncbi:DUF4258 domain-containing protein [Kitasatospora sp. HPMI-4]|uniref:DUF4258 domain-containing protein n=1 Tax=Kitasatospora sp. HPMI-4 TaxID=3448443 RepID=UPI003F1AB0E0
MIKPNRLRLAVAAVLTSGLALFSGPAIAATPALGNPPIHCDFDCVQRGCGPAAPEAVARISEHAMDRMNGRQVSQDELNKAIAIGAKSAWCQTDNGRWHYTVGMSGGELHVIVAGSDPDWVVVTVYWG